jgi:hypothetical protein
LRHGDAVRSGGRQWPGVYLQKQIVEMKFWSAASNKQIEPRCTKPWFSTSPTDVWEPLSRCACGLRSVPWTWSVSVCEALKKTPWYQLCEAWTWSVSEDRLET